MRPLIVDAMRVVTAAYLISMMFWMGLTLGGGPAEDKATKRREHWLLALGLAFNLILVPLLAVALTRVIGATGEVTIALLLLAAAPGGRFAPQIAKLAGAQLGLSVEITIFLAKLVSFTAPITARWMLQTHRIELHELTFIAQLLLLQFVPYLVGKQLRKRKPALAARLNRPMELVTWCCLLASLAVVLAARPLHGLLMLPRERGWLAVLAFAIVAPALGWLLGGPARETRRTFAVSANARDLGLTLVIASVALPQHGVQIALFAVWFFLVLVDVGYAKLVGARPRQIAPAAPAPSA
jgi:BASS family bile acid:Na+ symporter